MKSKLLNLYTIVQISLTSRRISQRSARTVLAMFVCCLFAGQAFAQGTWTAVTRQAPDANNGVMVLLTDGRVMCHSTAGGNLGDGTIWDILTPDATGSYVNGTWTQSAAMTQERYSFPAAILNNGYVYAAGGEYGTDGTQAGWHIEVYNPLTNTWTEATGPTSAKTISDGSCNILDNGDILQALVDVSMPVHTVFYNPTTNAETTAPSTRQGQNESMWLKLPDNSILFVDEGAQTSERYIPSLNQWVADGNVPVALYDPSGFECGPAWNLPNGKAFFVGGTNTSAIYTPSGTNAAGAWVAGPNPPTVGGLGYGMPDAPGAMMPNGNILLAMSPQPTSQNEFNSPTAFFEYNYLTNAYTAVAVPSSAASQAISQQYNMLVLPTGQVLLGMDQDNTSNQYYVYNPTGTPLDTGRPIINQIIPLTCTTYMAIGHRFNGISGGAAFGDENENDENYPLFRLQSGSNVYYARSYNWNSRGVQRGLTKIDTAYFQVPSGMPAGSYSLYAVTNGIPSAAFAFNNAIASLSSPLSNSICSGATFTYTPTSTTNGATFTWTRAAVTGISNAAITAPQSSNPNEVLVNTTAAPITVVYAYTVTGGGCTNVVDVSVSVNPKPVVSFTASPTTTCVLPDSVTFTNTTAAGNTYTWYFGDNTTSTATNPVHVYTAPGSYTVKLVASECGSDSLTQTNFIVNTSPSAPTAASQTHCGSASFTLSASTTNHVAWYDSTSGAFVSSANPYVTPVLTTSKTYYVQDTVPNVIDSVGPATYTTLGAGGIFTNTNQHYMTFDALENFTLISVVVDASTAGTRTIQLINASGTVLATATPNIPIGVSTVTLNFNVPTGIGYELSCSGTVNLYRNNAVTSGYPFTVPGVISITGNDVGTGYYYYFYNWKVQGAPCISARTTVHATIYPGGLTPTPTPTPVACYGGTTGGVSVTGAGGTPNYTYSWTGGHSGASVTGLAAGTYTVTMTDVNGCSASASTTVTQPSAALTLTDTVTNVACLNGNTGKIVVVPTGGTTNYTYLWNTTPQKTTATITNLTAGTYVVTVTDAHSCTATKSIAVTQSNTGLTLTTGETNATCGNANGIATVTVSSGTGTFTYTWSAGGSTTGTDPNLSAGNYTVTVSSTSGCSATAAVQVNSTGGPTVTPSVTGTTCGLNNGSAYVIPSGGTAPYTYAWNNSATDSSITALAAGTYTVTVQDVHGCASISSVTVTPSNGVALSTSSTPTTCGNSNGSATVSVSNPVSPTYHWNTSATGASITGVAASTYTVTVTNNGCSAVTSVSVASSSALTPSISSTATTCGAANGTATVSVTNPNSPTYTWNNNATTATINSLASGTYTVTVNNNGCSAVTSVSVTSSSPLSVNTSSTATTCGHANGGASASVTNPNSPTYHWSNNTNGASISNVASGSYTVTVTNAGCSATASVSIAASTGLTLTTSSTPAVCTQLNGAATVSESNPVNPTYAWSNSGTGANITGLAPGHYTVTVTDNGCSDTAGATVGYNSGTLLVSANTVVQDSCFGDATGSALANATGGTPNYTYNWSNNVSGASATGLAAGTYVVSVTDQDGCSTTSSVQVTQPNPLQAGASTTNINHVQLTGTATIDSIVGGTSPYVVSWSNGQSGDTATGLAAGTYIATITDNNGCSINDTVTIINTVLGINSVQGNISFSLYPNPAHTSVLIDIQNVNIEATLSLTDVLGQPLVTMPLVASQFSLDLTPYTSGIYFVQVSQNGQKAVRKLIITK